MLVNKAFKYRLIPNQQQEILLAKTFGCCRYVWNEVLETLQKEYDLYLQNPDSYVRPSLSPFSLTYRVLEIKKEKTFLNEVSAVALQQKLIDLGIAYKNFFKGSGYPQFKKRRSNQSFRLMNNGFSIKGGELYLAKSNEPFKVYWSRDLPNKPSQVTITKTSSGEYYVSFLCKVETQKTTGTKITGIDLGLKDLAICSDGTRIENPRFHNRKEKRLARTQRNHSRKQKDSVNRHKSRIKLAKLHQGVKNSRNDFLHKTTRRLVNENQVIGLEDLKIKNLVKNRRLSKAISDVGWGVFKLFLEYKAKESEHCKVIKVDPFFPSTQTCSVCNYRLVKQEKLKLHQRQWTCPSCNTKHDRDINAAVNLAHQAYCVFSTEWGAREGLNPKPVESIASAVLLGQ